MGQSYRIRTELGVNKTLNIELDQDFEFLEILSLTIQQSDVYLRNCANYGVVVGRVTANNGFGLPNARVSVFIPIEQVDESNPLISSIYPYKSPSDKNEDGYRYNLLPYEASYTGHAASGTLPTRLDALTGLTAVEIYDKYYKFTSKTNESGDYMIMGVPLGVQTLVMDVDLSDIGEFSLTPQDLIRMGRASEAQVAGNRFRTSTDLNSLPQIVNLTKQVDISPLWGDPSVCQIAINRVDFDLRDDASIDIQPTAVFMGSLISTADSFRVRKNAKPKDNMGNLCQLTTGPGQILSIRQTIQQDENGNPILEQHELEQSGNIIDGNGVWMTELPMNLDYLTTNEFGEKVLSNNPAIGIPTKGRYRFKIKWQQPPTLSEQVRRPYYLVPNVKEYGWSNTGTDPNTSSVSVTQKNKLSSSYYFGLDWSGYTQGFTGAEQTDRLNEIIDCEDTFYEFVYNRVYTVSSFIDEFKNGAKGRFIGIKEIDSQDCENTVNKFPVNEGFRNFDFLFFLFSILMQIVQLIGLPLLVVFHFLAFLWNNFAVPLLSLLILFFVRNAVQNFLSIAGATPFSLGLIAPFIAKGILNLLLSILLGLNFRKITSYRFGRIKMPMIQYPDCQACDCQAETTQQGGGSIPSSVLSQLSNPGLYYDNLNSKVTSQIVFANQDDDNGRPTTDDAAIMATLLSQAIAGRADDSSNNGVYKVPVSQVLTLLGPDERRRDAFSCTNELPYGERINLFNSRKKYFDSVNRISVSFDYAINGNKKHFDNTLTVITAEKLETGLLYTFVDPTTSQDVNYLFTGNSQNNILNGITGTSKQQQSGNIVITYANPSNQTQGLSLTYFLSTGSTKTGYTFPSDVEYYQVLTAITVQDAIKIWDTSNSESLPAILNSGNRLFYNIQARGLGIRIWGSPSELRLTPSTLQKYFTDFDNQYITIFQRGVDPYSPMYNNRYGIGKIFGLPNEDDIVITASTRLNIPIQPINSGLSIQDHRVQNNIFYPSYFFEAGNGFSSFTTSKVGYYSAMDATQTFPPINKPNIGGLIGTTSVNWNNTSNTSTPSSALYSASEDLSGVGYLFTQDVNSRRESNIIRQYYAPSLYDSFVSNPLTITSKVNNVLRTDRLPNSDYLDGSGWGNNNTNAAALQQNLGFATYLINTDGDSFTTDRYSTGGDIVTADIEGQFAEAEVISSLNTCSNMVGLSCYEGFGTSFGVNEECKNTDPVENGCYLMMRRPLLDLPKDFKTWSEWGFRFRFFYGLCRGVLSQTFTNNWINGTLYAFPIQVDTFFNNQNRPLPPVFAKELVFFDEKTNNFYYRSSPWIGNVQSGRFIGRPTSAQTDPTNQRNLLFPTTIMNLGMKDSFYQEIIFDPTTKAYVVNKLNPTSYSDTSDLVNLFVISRITDESFLKQLIPAGDNSLNQLFSRPYRRIDGDLAQLLSINSEFGVIPFSPEFYSTTGAIGQPVTVEGVPSNPTITVFFSSTTEDLQNKDLISPGVINFRPSNNQNAITYPIPIKTQKVPFYQWQIDQSAGATFGSQKNTWLTNTNNIVSYGYQSMNRRFTSRPSYFNSSYNSVSDIYQRGYIFSIDASQGYASKLSQAGQTSTNFVVGAPFQFYFGLIKGESALDKFKTKYLADE